MPGAISDPGPSPQPTAEVLGGPCATSKEDEEPHFLAKEYRLTMEMYTGDSDWDAAVTEEFGKDAEVRQEP